MGFRVFHWVMVVVFLSAYFSGDDAGLAHAWLGYACLLVLGWRVLATWRHMKGFPAGLRLRAYAVAGSGAGSLPLLLLSVMVLLVLGGVLMVDNAAVIRHGLQYLLPHPGLRAGSLFAGLPMVDAADVHASLATLSLWLVGLHIGLMLLLRRSALAFMLGWPTSKRVPARHVRHRAAAGAAADAVLQVSLRGESRAGDASWPASAGCNGAAWAAAALSLSGGHVWRMPMQGGAGQGRHAQ
jgi:3-ketosteroid 9alpha-monooxygenase subunit B